MYKAFVNWASECLEYKGLIPLTPAQNVPHPKSVNRQHDSLNPFLWRACFACNDHPCTAPTHIYAQLTACLCHCFGKGAIIICRFLRLRSDKTKPLLLAISLSAVAGALFSGWDLNCSPAALISSGVIALTTKAENLCTILLP